MVFSSPLFLFVFLPIVLGLYYLFPQKWRNCFLAIASFVFYAWGGLSFALLILLATVVNYFVGIYIDKNRLKGKRTLIIGILFNVLMLGFFKYFNFAVDNLEALIALGSPGFEFAAPIIPLPIGISFFTFQILSYVIDVYRGNVKAQKSFVNLSLYIMLFPQLIAGPIVRYADVEAQIGNRVLSTQLFEQGSKRFIIGLFKKVVIANNVGFIANWVFDNTGNLSTISAWVGIISYSLQIFFDFSGYSDMAIGLGKMFGFTFLENFNFPYISKNIKEFWRRWHISLSSWFRDYLYIPLGGNRKGEIRTYLNLLIVFFVTGLWHGASWNFVIWGLFHGSFLMLERSKWGSIQQKAPSILRHIYTLLIVLVGWVFFRANTVAGAGIYLQNMFSLNMENWTLIFSQITVEYIIVLIVGIILCTPLLKRFYDWTNMPMRKTATVVLVNCGYIALFILTICMLATAAFNPFIYFRF